MAVPGVVTSHHRNPETRPIDSVEHNIAILTPNTRGFLRHIENTKWRVLNGFTTIAAGVHALERYIASSRRALRDALAAHPGEMTAGVGPSKWGVAITVVGPTMEELTARANAPSRYVIDRPLAQCRSDSRFGWVVSRAVRSASSLLANSIHPSQRFRIRAHRPAPHTTTMGSENTKTTSAMDQKRCKRRACLARGRQEAINHGLH